MQGAALAGVEVWRSATSTFNRCALLHGPDSDHKFWSAVGVFGWNNGAGGGLAALEDFHVLGAPRDFDCFLHSGRFARLILITDRKSAWKEAIGGKSAIQRRGRMRPSQLESEGEELSNFYQEGETGRWDTGGENKVIAGLQAAGKPFPSPDSHGGRLAGPADETDVLEVSNQAGTSERRGEAQPKVDADFFK